MLYFLKSPLASLWQLYVHFRRVQAGSWYRLQWTFTQSHFQSLDNFLENVWSWICLLLPRLLRESSPPKLTFSACYGALLVAILWGLEVRFILTKHCFIHLLHRNCKPLLPGRILWQGGRLCWAATSMSAPAPEGKLGGSWHCLAVG